MVIRGLQARCSGTTSKKCRFREYTSRSHAWPTTATTHAPTNDATVAGFANATTAAVATTGIAGLNVSGFGSAQTALVQVDKALAQINTSRANLGALQSRFENVVSNIQIASENVAAARGRIVDADFAQETANFSRAQILQQAGTAMVAQANQLPQQVLQLLR